MESKNPGSQVEVETLSGLGFESPRSWISARMFLLVWIPIAVITTLHYATPAEHAWVHDVLRRVYYLPIVLAAFLGGLPGGIAAAILVSVAYLPHAFVHPTHFDPGRGAEKLLEIMLYHVVGGGAGYLAGKERRRSRELQVALEEQRRLTRQVTRAERLSVLGQVMAGMAHEIKNPLHSLIGTAEIIDPLVPREAAERRLWDLHKTELQRLSDVAERFLSFGRPTAPEKRALDLREVALRTHDLLAAEARQKGVEFILVPATSPVMLQGDRDQLAQVSINIILNGFNAMGSTGGLVKLGVAVQTEGSRDYGVLRIENDGPPIPEEMLERIFDPFTSGGDASSGLGLSISERIVEQHGGFIEASNSGLGVTFLVCLPLNRDLDGGKADRVQKKSASSTAGEADSNSNKSKVT
jgi:signal transduction histidine kinase